MRTESQEAHFLGEMQIAATTIEEALAAWQVDPLGSNNPAESPVVLRAAADFRHWTSQLVALIDADELSVVQGFESAFISWNLWRPTAGQRGFSAGACPVLLIVALAGLVFVVRLQNRSRQLDEQRRLNEAKNAFIASGSHELRTPLTPVVAYAHELRDRMDDFSPEEVAEFIEFIEVTAIVQDLLVAARPEIDQVSLVPEIVDIREQIQQALQTLDAVVSGVDTTPDDGAASMCGLVIDAADTTDHGVLVRLR
jgi:signal transduction histidine kinase